MAGDGILQKYFVVRISEQNQSLSLSLSLPPFLMSWENVSASPAILCMGIKGGIMGRAVGLKPEDSLLP